MKSFFIIILILSSFLGSCNKVRKYRFNIVNETGVEINKMELTGTTDYEFEIEKNGETGESQIQWKGPRSHLNGEYCFSYYVYSFTDIDSTYNDENPCGGCVVVRHLSQKKLNVLTLRKVDPGQSDCEHYFKMDYKEY